MTVYPSPLFLVLIQLKCCADLSKAPTAVRQRKVLTCFTDGETCTKAKRLAQSHRMTVIAMPYHRVHPGCSRALYRIKTREAVNSLICLKRTKVCCFYIHLKSEIEIVGEEGGGTGEQSKEICL